LVKLSTFQSSTKVKMELNPTNGRRQGNEHVNLELALGYKFEPSSYIYTEKDVILYALSIGVASNDATSDSALQFTYENHPQFKALPTMGVLFPFPVIGNLASIPGLSFNPMMLLHGEQYLELKRPIPTSGKLMNYAHVSHIYDKGKGALLLVDCTSKDEKGEEVCFNQLSLYIRGIGGFGGDRGSNAELENFPSRKPDAIQLQKTNPNQALLYRLCGDLNPLHADPQMASFGGFEKPILHGLCTFGIAGTAVLKHFCDDDPRKLKSIRVRFSKHVFPGETVITEMWRISPTKVVFQCKVVERPEVGPVLSNCVIELHLPRSTL